MGHHLHQRVSKNDLLKKCLSRSVAFVKSHYNRKHGPGLLCKREPLGLVQCPLPYLEQGTCGNTIITTIIVSMIAELREVSRTTTARMTTAARKSTASTTFFTFTTTTGSLTTVVLRVVDEYFNHDLFVDMIFTNMFVCKFWGALTLAGRTGLANMTRNMVLKGWHLVALTFWPSHHCRHWQRG